MIGLLTRYRLRVQRKRREAAERAWVAYIAQVFSDMEEVSGVSDLMRGQFPVKPPFDYPSVPWVVDPSCDPRYIYLINTAHLIPPFPEEQDT